VKTTKDLYKLLGLPREASQDDIRKAHRKLVREYHPDANPDDRSAEERFKQIQHAYEVLSNPEKRREYDRRLHTTSRGGSGRPRARGGGRTRGETTPTVDLSDLLNKLADLSSDRSSAHKEGSSQLRGEEIARVANLLGVDVSRISELLGRDITRLSKLVGENLKMNAKVTFGGTRSGGDPVTDEDVSSRERSGMGDWPREKRVKGPRAQRKEKKVKGPRARRKRKGD
jgi:curved DNA-binding protein CbpA